MHVIVRPPSPAFSAALSEHPERDQIDPGRALAEHRAFVAALRSTGAANVELPAAPDLPDGPFVSDTILALPHATEPDGPTRLLVVTRPTEPSRQPEVDTVAACARQMILADVPEVRIQAPDTLEGGDVIVLGERLLIGLSGRTNAGGARRLAQAAREIGYHPYLCPVEGRLHLATAVTAIGPTTLVGTAAGFASIDAAGPDAAPRDTVHRLLVPDDELPAANVLALSGRCIVASGNPRTVELLRANGQSVVEVELDEFTRADGGPTCLVAIIP